MREILILWKNRRLFCEEIKDHEDEKKFTVLHGIKNDELETLIEDGWDTTFNKINARINQAINARISKERNHLTEASHALINQSESDQLIAERAREERRITQLKIQEEEAIAVAKARETHKKVMDELEKLSKEKEDLKIAEEAIEQVLTIMKSTKDFNELKNLLSYLADMEIPSDELRQKYNKDTNIIKKYNGYVNVINTNLMSLKELLSPVDLKVDKLYEEFSDYHETIKIKLKETGTNIKEYNTISGKISKLLTEVSRDINKIMDDGAMDDETKEDETKEDETKEDENGIIFTKDVKIKILEIFRDSLVNLNFNLTIIEAYSVYGDDIERLCRANECKINCLVDEPPVYFHDEHFANAIVEQLQKDITADSIGDHILKNPNLSIFTDIILLDNHVSEHVQKNIKSLLTGGILPYEWDKITSRQ